MLRTDWTRVLAMALVLPFAAACAEGGEEEIDETETLETAPTTEMNRVELEPFGTADIEGWITSRTEGEEVILTLNIEGTRTGMRGTPEAGTEGESGAARAEAEDMRHSARLVEGTCLDVRPGAERLAPGETPSERTGQPEPEAGAGQHVVRTVADFEQPDMGGAALEARVERSELTGHSYAVVVEDGEQEGVTGGEAAGAGQENIVACADVSELVRNVGSPATGTPGPGTEPGSGESGSNY